MPGRIEAACAPVRALLVSMGLIPEPRDRHPNEEAGQLAREILSGAHDVESPRGLARTGSFSSTFFGSTQSSGESPSTHGVLQRAGSGSTLFGGLVRTGSVPRAHAADKSRDSPEGVIPNTLRTGARPASPLPRRTSVLDWTNPRSVAVATQIFLTSLLCFMLEKRNMTRISAVQLRFC